jgi:glycosyltransferase involved in cell wall biosynthesis
LDQADVRIHVAVRATLPFAPIGGLERASRAINEGIIAAGLNVCVHTPTQGIAPAEDLKYVDVIWPSDQRRRRRWAFPVEYRIWNRRLAISLANCVEDDDVILYHGAAVGAAASQKLRRHGRRSVYNPHGLEEFAPLTWISLLTRPQLRWIIVAGTRRVARVIATDESLVTHLRRSLRIGDEKLVTVPNGVDVSRLRSIAEASPNLDAGWFLCSVGRLAYNKGYDLLAEALVRLHRDRALPPFWRWVHFGTGEERAKVISIAAQGQIEDRISIRGGVPDDIVQSYVARCSIFVQPSRFEGSSLTTLEAMAHRRVVVATPIGGIPDKVTHGVSGFLARAADPHSLCQAILEAAACDGVSIGERAFSEVQRRFSLDLAIRTYVRLFDSLASERDGGERAVFASNEQEDSI